MLIQLQNFDFNHASCEYSIIFLFFFFLFIWVFKSLLPVINSSLQIQILLFCSDYTVLVLEGLAGAQRQRESLFLILFS